MPLRQSIIIAGPTTTGKSEISEIIARQVGGAIINTDNYYFYANEEFHIGLGLAKNEPATDIPSYLFGIRKISQPKPDPIEFLKLVEEVAANACERGLVPIIQGCYFTLNNALISLNKTPHVYVPIWHHKNDLRNRCRMRVEQMLDEGLLDEAQRLIDSGHDTSWIAKEGIIYAPTLHYLRNPGQTREELTAAICDGIMTKAIEQETKYRGLKNVHWIPHHNNPVTAASKILQQWGDIN